MNLAEITLPNGKSFHLIVVNNMTAFRADSFWRKEPHTIEWLDTLQPGDLLWDIGANIGVYSLYAATRGVEVMAFEPESQNFGLLNMQIFYNRLGDLITAYPIALGDKIEVSKLYLTQFDTGGSCHQFGDLTSYSGIKPIKAAYEQGSIAMRASTIAEMTGRKPTHVKIDVDGHEPQVVEGLMGLDSIKSLIIETNWTRDDHKAMVELLQAEGFTYNEEQANAAKRKEGAFIGCGETVFTAGDHLQDRQRRGEKVAVPASVH